MAKYAETGESGFAQRLYEAVRASGGIDAVSAASGVPARSISSYISAAHEPKAGAIVRLATACGVSPGWLLTGCDTGSGAIKQVPAAMAARTDLAFIPVLDVDASAGPGAVAGRSDVLDSMPFPSATLRRLGVNPDLVEFIRARGDSMEPTIQSGTLVLVDRSKREIREDGVYAFSIDGEIRIKRIRRNVGGSFTLLSDNKALYPDETVSLADAQTLRIHGRVFWAEKYV